MFSVFFLLFLFMFSISSYRLANGRSDFAMSVIWPLFRRGLWEIFGELNEAVYLGNVTDCNGTTAASLSCQARSATLIIFVAAYLFATTILLVNLLIAACTCIFEEKNIQAQNLWRYQKYKLLRSYEWATMLPWPFSMVENRIMDYFLRQHKTASTTGKGKSSFTHSKANGSVPQKKISVVESWKSKLTRRKKFNPPDVSELLPLEQTETEIFERDVGYAYFRMKESAKLADCDKSPTSRIDT